MLMHKLGIVALCSFLSLTPSAYASQVNIQDITGVRADVGDKVVLRYLDQDFTFSLSKLLIPEVNVPLLNPVLLMKIADRIDAQIGVEEQSAYIDQLGRVVEHQSGIGLDRKQFVAVLQKLLYSPNETSAMLPIAFKPPRITTQQLKLAMERQISSFATYYNARNSNRTHNIRLASSAIHHYILLPGEVFSFNKVVGKRTVDKGYKRAPVIVRGELSEGVGGGICQVSSTLFNAVDKAGLTILKRYSHSKQVGYVPPGRDATVSWYGPDFAFRNDYDHPIMIKCYADHGVNVVTIHSSRSLEAELRNVPEAPKRLPRETHSQ
ncbi:VanW family protein [Ammoniphilus sp. 3BR4]|uniref:VanW family protein n=1 Tax=Ammoniphilus sp. 3BR4 TaxID=3158265 RepID=UPI00346662FE